MREDIMWKIVLKRIFFLIFLILTFKAIEIFLDYFVGNNDGEFLIVRYLLGFSIGVYFLYISRKIITKGISNFTLVVSSVTIILSTLELLFFILVNVVMPAPQFIREQTTDSFNNKFSMRDNDIGYVATSSAKTTEVLYSHGVEIDRSFYHTDSLGRRVASGTINENNRSDFACFFGCSFTFGLSVNDDQTLPSQFEKYSKNFKSYNYGMNGYGPQHILSKIKSMKPEELSESKGIFIYVFIDDHIRRAIGDQFFMESNIWADASPYYKLHKDDLKLEGTFGVNRKWKNHWYRILNKSYTLRYFNIKFPVISNDGHYLLTAKLIEACYLEYTLKFEHDNFFVLIFPGQSTKITSFLNNNKINVLDFSDILDLTNAKHHNPGDYHPSPLTYELVARQLSKDIQGIYKVELSAD